MLRLKLLKLISALTSILNPILLSAHFEETRMYILFNNRNFKPFKITTGKETIGSHYNFDIFFCRNFLLNSNRLK